MEIRPARVRSKGLASMMRIYIYYTCNMATGYPGPKDKFNPEEVSVLGRILYKYPREKVARPGARPGANIV
jgi:hypothetical protein